MKLCFINTKHISALLLISLVVLSAEILLYLYFEFRSMSLNFLRKIRVFFSSTVLPKQNWSQTSGRSYCATGATESEKMDAVKTMKDLGYAFNKGNNFSYQCS